MNDNTPVDLMNPTVMRIMEISNEEGFIKGYAHGYDAALKWALEISTPKSDDRGHFLKQTPVHKQIERILTKEENDRV